MVGAGDRCLRFIAFDFLPVDEMLSSFCIIIGSVGSKDGLCLQDSASTLCFKRENMDSHQ